MPADTPRDPSDFETIEEAAFVSDILQNTRGGTAPCHMTQIGANEGKFEYAKEDGKDFVYEFLRDTPNWSALLIEPIPDIFERLKANYAAHPNTLYFLNCAITETLEERVLHLTGKDGKASSLVKKGAGPMVSTEDITVPCLRYDFACRVVNAPVADFIKIDAEGYDETIVHSILDTLPETAYPNALMWEQLGPERLGTSDRLRALGYRVVRTGLARNGMYLDLLALR